MLAALANPIRLRIVAKLVAADVSELRTRTASIGKILRTVE